MEKRLVKRSSFQRILVTETAPVSLLVQGDEAYVQMVVYGAGKRVRVFRQIDREFAKVSKAGDELPLMNALILGNNARRSLGERTVWQLNKSWQDESGVDLLTGISDNMRFELDAGMTGRVELVIETVNYERI
ncbi:hypothetical protein GCM10028807_49940 [Spirosoma daeguense]